MSDNKFVLTRTENLLNRPKTLDFGTPWSTPLPDVFRVRSDETSGIGHDENHFIRQKRPTALVTQIAS